MNIEIEVFIAKRDYRYLWLKNVQGVNLKCHCARCLIGPYDKNFGSHVKMVRNVSLSSESPLYYLCGVAQDRKWSHNLHIAFTYAPGQDIDIDDEFCTVKIKNARRLDIDMKYIDWDMPESKKSEYKTCRNWQFANMISKGLMPNYRPRNIQYSLFKPKDYE